MNALDLCYGARGRLDLRRADPAATARLLHRLSASESIPEASSSKGIDQHGGEAGHDGRTDAWVMPGSVTG